MPEPSYTHLEQLRASLAGLEAQRALLGDAVVEPALAALRHQIAALEAQAIPPPADARRFATILFTDLVGSTALAEKLDPEEWREVVAGLHDRTGRTIQQHGGRVVQYLGDGLLALFGAQGPDERDAENAIRAALDIQRAPSSLRLRIGIHTGLVVVGEMGSDARREFTATGDAMNLAARLQAAAPPGGVLISRDTYRHARGAFDVEPQPPLAVKGKAEPVQTYLVLRARPRPFRVPENGVAGIHARTIGRETELARLSAALSAALEHGQRVWAQVIGEPGMGKSRLLAEIESGLESQPGPLLLLRARACQGDQSQPYSLARRFWFDRFQIAEDAPLAEAEARWVERFSRLAGAGARDDGTSFAEEQAHALGLLVGLPFEGSPHIGALRGDPAQVKGRAYVVSRRLLTAVRAAMPIILLLEDLHWADASSWDYLTQVVLDAAAPAPRHGLCVLATARPEWNPPETLRHLSAVPGADPPDALPASRYIQVDLAPLPQTACRELAAELLQPFAGVPEDALQLIVARSEGVPYYAEEIVNWFLDRGVLVRDALPWRFVPGRLQESPLPATLHHLLLTRLGALSDRERLVLQRGAIFGRNFWEGGLEALEVRDSASILPRLHPRGFVDPQPVSSLAGDAEWSFHHSLLRDVAHESLLRRERRRLHGAAAAWLEAQALQAGRLDEFAGAIGDHAEQAGLSAAADWHLRAGDHARARGALAEARRAYERALDLLPPADLERRWHACLGHVLAVKLMGDTTAYRAATLALLDVARGLDDSRRAEAHFRHGYYLDATGDYRSALGAYQTALALARSAGNAEVEVGCLALIAISQLRLGDPAGASDNARIALSLAGRIDPAIAARPLMNVAVYEAETGDLARAAQLQAEAAAIARRMGDRAMETNALSNLGYDYVCLGLYGPGCEALEQSIQVGEAIGVRRELAYSRLNLALARWRSGDLDAARRTLDQVQAELAGIGDAFAHAAGLSYLALIDESAGDWQSAAGRFAQAGEILGALGVRGYAMDAAAGQARCALAQGDLPAAVRLAAEVEASLAGSGWEGMEFPIRACLTCAAVFEQAGDSGQARALVEAGWRELSLRAARISDPDWRASFLDQVPEHQELARLWENPARVTS